MITTALRVLVAEDDPTIRMLMVEILEDEGYDVVEACDGTEAFHVMDDPGYVDLIVTDFHMPGFNGVEVAKRARERHPAIPVLFVSARADVIADADAPEPYSALKKPFTMAELGAAVRKLAEQLSR